MADFVKQMDYAKSAQAAVDFNHDIHKLIAHFNPRGYQPRLFQIKVIAKWLTTNERLFKYLHEYMIRTDLVREHPPKPHEVVTLFFEDKDGAKQVREIVDQEFFAPIYRSANRNPDDHSRLCQIKPGPDHKRVTGRVE